MGEKASMWNLWHGCHKWSEGCRHCYVYRHIVIPISPVRWQTLLQSLYPLRYEHKIIICEPLLSSIDFRGELEGWVEQVVAGGESGKEARVCNYDWILDIRRQCVEANVGFWFKQTGSYLLKDGTETEKCAGA